MTRYLVCGVCFALAGTLACDLSDPRDLPAFDQITTGANHTCARTPSRVTYCWGADSAGQLGLGTPSTQAHPRPTAVANQPVFLRITAFSGHTCGITLALKPSCWGNNESGQLGQGDSANRAEPTDIATVIGFVTVATGDRHTCGLSPDASVQGGAVALIFCWGDNTYGQVGDSTNTPRPTLTRVASGTTRFISVSVGGRHSCALDNEGAAYCWGDNTYGQLGDGTTLSSDAPIPSAGGLRFARLTTGSSHSCGIDAANQAHCWGRGAEGQLGVTTVPESCGGIPCSTTPLPVSGSLRFGTITTGAEHSCAVTIAAEAVCWGRNTGGQLGAATSATCNGVACSPTAVPVGGSLAVFSIVAGGSHTCAFTTDAVPYCWGANGSGQLGDGSTTPRPSPVRVPRP